MKLHRFVPALLAGGLLVATAACEELLTPELTELLGVSCEDGADDALVGDWTATFYDWGEGDVIAQGREFRVQLFDDGDGRVTESRPDEDGTGGTVMVADSASITWLGCDGAMAVVIEESWINSSDGGFDNTEFSYELSGDQITLNTTDGGTLVMTKGQGPTDTPGLDPALFGGWTATHKVVTETGGAGRSVDLIVDEGHSMDVTFSDGGTYLEVYQDGGVTEGYEGVWSADGEVLILRDEADGPVTQTLSYVISGDEARVTDADDESYDFDDDGTAEPVTIEYTFIRQ